MSYKLSLKVLLVWLCLLMVPVLADDVIISLPTGDILGRKDSSYTGKTYYNFQKIPYAAPPINELRFQAPVPPDNWDTVLNATYLDVICPQQTSDPTAQSEDCLYINVFTPELPDGDNNVSIPVLFYIHGGGIKGHSMPYSLGPEYLIDHDVVIVTFNYRLGAFGFLSTQDTVVPGNNGLKDQLLAMQWVHTNIHLFGGDPDKITIAGTSTGAVSVGYQLLNKIAKGLFRAAIMESGTAISTFTLQRNAAENAFALASLLNDTFANVSDSDMLLEYLLTVPVERLSAASSEMPLWSPVIEPEHDGAFITEKMYGLIRTGNFVKVPILMGITSEESLRDASDLNFFLEVMKLYDKDVQLLVPDSMNMFLSDDNKEIFGENIRKIYCGNETFAQNLAAGVRFNSDTTFNRGGIKCAELKSQFVDVFFYQFSYDGIMGNITISLEGAEHVAHAEEMHYIWRTTMDGYDNSDLSKFPEADVLTQHRMLTLWTNFVKYLNPTPEEDELLQNVTWPTVSSGEKGDFYLDIGQNLEVKNHPKEETYRRWLELYAMLGTNDFDTF